MNEIIFYHHSGAKAQRFAKSFVYSLCVTLSLRVLVAKAAAMIFATLILTSCKKDNPPPMPTVPGEFEKGILVLNEGLYQQNNSSVCFYRLSDGQVYTQAFASVNDRGLGDTGNDFKKYTLNGKEYILILVDVSSQVEIVEAITLKSVAQIPLFDGTNAREPRHVEIYGSTAFVCNFDGTVSVIDLNSNTVSTTLSVGANPDGMLQFGSKLYISNSGGLNFPLYDTTMTVINMNTKTVVDTVETRINCASMVMDSQQEIYLHSIGNHMDVEPALLRINTTTNEVIQQFEQPISGITAVGDWLYYYDSDASAIKRFNMLTETFEGTVIINCADVETFYGMQYEEGLGLIFCFDAEGYVNSSTVRAYSPAGVLQFEFTAELNAKKIIYNE